MKPASYTEQQRSPESWWEMMTDPVWPPCFIVSKRRPLWGEIIFTTRAATIVAQVMAVTFIAAVILVAAATLTKL